MRWRGETEQQRRRRVSEWHRRFAWVPVQMEDGTWVWLEDYEAQWQHGCGGTPSTCRRLPSEAPAAPETIDEHPPLPGRKA